MAGALRSRRRPLVRRLLADGKLVAPLKAVTGSARAYLPARRAECGRASFRSTLRRVDAQTSAGGNARAGVEQFYGRKPGAPRERPRRRARARERRARAH